VLWADSTLKMMGEMSAIDSLAYYDLVLYSAEASLNAAKIQQRLECHDDANQLMYDAKVLLASYYP
jgi:hypothetical protein